MKFYIATRLENAANHNLLRDLMVEQGHSITYDWTVHGPVWREGAERIREVSELELKGVADANVCLVLMPGGRGTHVELGIALGLQKPCLVISENAQELMATSETCAFYHHPRVLRVSLQHLGLHQANIPALAASWVSTNW